MIDENVCDAGFCNHIYSDRFRFETFNLKLSAWIFQFEIILRVLGSYWKFRKLILAESNRTASIEGPLEDFFREILIEKFSQWKRFIEIETPTSKELSETKWNEKHPEYSVITRRILVLSLRSETLYLTLACQSYCQPGNDTGSDTTN